MIIFVCTGLTYKCTKRRNIRRACTMHVTMVWTLAVI